MFVDADIPAGIGRKFLHVYGERLDPEIHVLLEQREAKEERATMLYERGRRMPGDPGDRLRERARRMRQEVKMGEYAIEVDDASRDRGPAGDPNPRGRVGGG
jgi:hypothetical protein